MQEPAPSRTKESRALLRLIETLANGALLVELGEELATLLQVIATHAHNWGNAKGELTLTLSFKSDGRKVMTGYRVRRRGPVRPRNVVTTFHVTHDGELTKNDPRQLKVPGTDDERGVAGDRCEVGNECGRTGCPECQQ